jgi:hypothetical protein
MVLGALVAGSALKGGVEAVAAVVDRPDRELVRYRARFDGEAVSIGHGTLIGAGRSRLEPAAARQPAVAGEWRVAGTGEAGAIGSIPIAR